MHAAALLLRAKDHVWCMDCPDGATMSAAEVNEKGAPLLRLFSSRLPRSR